jgi:hypothetical protein
VDSFFSSPALFDDLHTKTINCCGTIISNRRGMPKNFEHKITLKGGDLNTEVKGNLTAIVWKDKRNVNILMNVHSPCNFCDECGKAVKLAMIWDCDRQVGYVD